jgi:hypothetical protein
MRTEIIAVGTDDRSDDVMRRDDYPSNHMMRRNDYGCVVRRNNYWCYRSNDHGAGSVVPNAAA